MRALNFHLKVLFSFFLWTNLINFTKLPFVSIVPMKATFFLLFSIKIFSRKKFKRIESIEKCVESFNKIDFYPSESSVFFKLLLFFFLHKSFIMT